MTRYLLIALSCVVIGGIAAHAPRYLSTQQEPVRADIIVLLVGSETTTPQRYREAVRLLENGYAGKILVPAYSLFLDPGTTRAAELPVPAGHPVSNIKRRTGVFAGYPKYYENTHVELLEAKRLMDVAGLKSGVLVSSPHHMRRIGMIAERVFNDKTYRFTLVSTRHSEATRLPWFLSGKALDSVLGEYFKILWFAIYGAFHAGSS